MNYVTKRVAQLVVVLIAVTFLSSLFLSLLPGDAVISICGFSCSTEQYNQVREEMGLNQPIVVRYADWLNRVVHGDLGASKVNGEEVSTALSQRLPVTFELLIMSQLIALGVAIPLGVWSARRPNGRVDKASTGIGFVCLAVPPFVIALLLIDLFAVHLHLFPATGYKTFLESPAENIRDLMLPAITLALAEIAVFSRLLRTDLMATLQEDYIMLAKAKGLPSRRIMWRHAFRPSTFSLITLAGLRIGALIGGTIIIERVFVINGLGLYAINAIERRDYIPLQGAVVVIAVGYVLINFAVDMLYAVLDPRIRHARAIA
jgi:peptide/nickel transport system permease protein